MRSITVTNDTKFDFKLKKENKSHVELETPQMLQLDKRKDVQ